jgi:uncharacterized RDD family membrane protein YckC
MHNDAWFYARDNQQLGPVSFEALATLARSGILTPNDLVWHEGMMEWAPAGTVSDLFAQAPVSVAVDATSPPFSPDSAAAPLQAGGPTIGYYTPLPPTGIVQYPSFWLRFCGYFLDYLLTWAVSQGLQFAVVTAVSRTAGTGSQNAIIGAGLSASVASIVLSWLYEALMESSSYQATLGKLAVGIKVCDMYGRRISFARATGRHFGKILSGLILLIGYIMAAFTERKQALHDIMAGTLVVKQTS